MEKISKETFELREKLENRYFTAVILIILSFVILFFLNINFDLGPFALLIGPWYYIGIIIMAVGGIIYLGKVMKIMNQKELIFFQTWSLFGYKAAFIAAILSVIMMFVVRSSRTGVIIFFVSALISFASGLYLLRTVKKNKIK